MQEGGQSCGGASALDPAVPAGHTETARESRSVVSDSANAWTAQSTEFSRPGYWSGQPFPSPGDRPNPGMEARPPAVQADSLPAEPPGRACRRERPKNADSGWRAGVEPSAPGAAARVSKGGENETAGGGCSWSAVRPHEGWVLDLKQEHPAGCGVPPQATLRNRGSKRWTWVGVNPGGSLAQKRADVGGHVGGVTRGDVRDGSLAGVGRMWMQGKRRCSIRVGRGGGIGSVAERSQWWPSATTRPNMRGWKGWPQWDRRRVLGAGNPGSPRAGRLT